MGYLALLLPVGAFVLYLFLNQFLHLRLKWIFDVNILCFFAAIILAVLTLAKSWRGKGPAWVAIILYGGLFVLFVLYFFGFFGLPVKIM